jgi:hypothetical protein
VWDGAGLVCGEALSCWKLGKVDALAKLGLAVNFSRLVRRTDANPLAITSVTVMSGPTADRMCRGSITQAVEPLRLQEAPKCPFLDVPYKIRSRIYLTVGILGNLRHPKFINLSNVGAPDHNHDRWKFVNTYRLLLTCKTVYREVLRLVYRFNKFFARPDDHGSLAVLYRLRPNMLCFLLSLTIHVNVSSCGLADQCVDFLYPWRRYQYDYDKLAEPLCLSKEPDRVWEASLITTKAALLTNRRI